MLAEGSEFETLAPLSSASPFLFQTLELCEYVRSCKGRQGSEPAEGTQLPAGLQLTLPDGPEISPGPGGQYPVRTCALWLLPFKWVGIRSRYLGKGGRYIFVA